MGPLYCASVPQVGYPPRRQEFNELVSAAAELALRQQDTALREQVLALANVQSCRCACAGHTGSMYAWGKKYGGSLAAVLPAGWAACFCYIEHGLGFHCLAAHCPCLNKQRN